MNFYSLWCFQAYEELSHLVLLWFSQQLCGTGRADTVIPLLEVKARIRLKDMPKMTRPMNGRVIRIMILCLTERFPPVPSYVSLLTSLKEICPLFRHF